MIEKLSNSEYSKKSILQKPIISTLIPLLISQNGTDLISNKAKYHYFFINHLSIDITEYILEILLEYTNNNNYQSTFIIQEILKCMDYIPTSIRPLKNILDNSTFDLNLNIHMESLLDSTGGIPKLNLCSLVSNIPPILSKMLIKSQKRIETNINFKDKHIHVETFGYLKYLLIIPVRIAHKTQQYDPNLPSQRLLTTTANFETILQLENLEIYSSNLKEILKLFFFQYNHECNCQFTNGCIYQIIICLIHQIVPCLHPDKLDKDIFHTISCYKLKIDYIIILIEFYIRKLVHDFSENPLNLKSEIIYIFSIYIKVPFDHNDKQRWDKYALFC